MSEQIEEKITRKRQKIQRVIFLSIVMQEVRLISTYVTVT